MPSIVHISSVHNANDPRIRRKQLGAVLAEGWRAIFITGDCSSVSDDFVELIKVMPGNTRRVARLFLTSPLSIIRALWVKADLYHIHDPELLPWAWLLLLKRKPVVYDVHEDYVTSIRQKAYIPAAWRSVVAEFVGAVESQLSRPFYRVIAEKYYVRRFPNATQILNYPSRELAQMDVSFCASSTSVLYTGNVTLERGALQVSKLLSHTSDWAVTIVGHCSNGVAERMRRAAGEGQGRLLLIGEGRYVPFEEIQSEYAKKKWLAGIALFPDTPHYREKELTKFFEYMAIGLPIVASSFPVWRDLIERNRVGLCVDADDPGAVAAALGWLRNNPVQAAEMGQRGRRLVQKAFNWEREGERLMRFYKSVLSRAEVS